MLILLVKIKILKVISNTKNTLKSKDINNVFNEAKHNFNVKLKNTKNG